MVFSLAINVGQSDFKIPREKSEAVACPQLYFSTSVWNGQGTFLREKCKEDCAKLADRCWKTRHRTT